MPKCSECLSCLDLIYFGNKRFYHCWLCDKWYDGILPNLFVVPKEEIDKYISTFGNPFSPAVSVETNSDK